MTNNAKPYLASVCRNDNVKILASFSKLLEIRTRKPASNQDSFIDNVKIMSE